jgi:hypothetical protein
MKNIANSILAACIAGLLSGCTSIGETSGIKPSSPPYWYSFYSGVPEVDSLTPTLKWEPLETENIDGDLTDIRYDVDIFTVSGLLFQDETVDYHKEDIVETSLVVESPLQPDKRYFWRIRAKYKQNGREVTGDWNSRSDLRTGVSPYFFDTPKNPE